MIEDPDQGSTKSLIHILSATNFVIGMGAFMVIGMLPPMADDLGLSTAGAGWIMTIYALSYAVASPLLVSATGGIGRRKVLFLGLAVFAGAAVGASIGGAVIGQSGLLALGWTGGAVALAAVLHLLVSARVSR